MNKLFSALLAFIFINLMLLRFAEETSGQSNTNNSTTPAQVSSETNQAAQVPNSAAAITLDKTMTFTGIVDIISSSQITLKDDNGQEAVFAIATDTTVIDRNGNATTLNWINKGDKVSIEYTAAEAGAKTAKSVTILSTW